MNILFKKPKSLKEFNVPTNSGTVGNSWHFLFRKYPGYPRSVPPPFQFSQELLSELIQFKKGD